MFKSWIGLIFCFYTFGSLAKDIPDELADWVDWVKYDQSYRQCPYFSDQKSSNRNSHVCAWPQQLKLDVSPTGADFTVTWELLDDSWVPLPGDTDTWPLQVSSNQKPMPIQQHNNKPRVYLNKGIHVIKGRFQWQSRPEAISIPSEVADVELTLGNSVVSFPVLQNNTLWLGESSNEEKIEANNLDIEINRLIIDGHPMTVFVAIDLQVSGVARNEKLGKIGSADYQITDISGDLNAYIDQSGDLWAQLKPGYNEILVGMNIKGWPEQLNFEPTGEFWPQQEIWAYQDNKNIRLTQIEGVTAINPEQSSSRWNQVPNFLLNSGDAFVISEQKRGTLNQSESLTLSREAWLSFTGKSFLTKDHITGDKLGSWRLNSIPELKLLSATNAQDENLLITTSASGQQGMELRQPNVSLQVNGEIASEFKQQISGWDINFDSISTQLFLPPGYKVLATQQVDYSQNVWLEQWRLWDIFIVMLLTVLSFKIIGVKSALFAFVSLVLGYQGINMPLYSWANLILALALIAWLPHGRWLKVFQGYALVSVLALVVLLIPHLVAQARWTIHPQLEHQRVSSSDMVTFSKAKKQSRLNQIHQQTYNLENAMPSSSLNDQVEEQGKITVTGSRIRRADLINKYQTDALLQAGKATPEWRQNQVLLQWDGPITSAQQYKLILLTPWMQIIWRILLILTTVLWLLSIITRMLALFKQKKLNLKKNSTTTALLWVLTFGITQTSWAADFPSEKMLQELQNRVFPESMCQSACASLELAAVSVDNNQLQINLTYHSLDRVVVPIPDSSEWHVTGILVNGQKSPNRLQHNNQQWIVLDAGISLVEMSGKLASRNNISVKFPIKPGQISTSSDHWQFAGTNGQTLTSNTLQLIATNLAVNSETDEKSQTTEINAFVKLVRSITFDDQWYVNNYVTRVAPKQGVLNVSIPLLANEFPVEKLQQNEQGHVIVNLAPNEESFSWRSRLERLPQFNLTAADDNHYLEQWHIVSSPQWHVEISGVPLVAAEDMAQDFDDYFVHVYLPRPNESIAIDVTRPDAVAGDILAIDAINNTYSIGKRITKTTTKINYRATQGGRFAVNLAPDALVKKVSYDGVESNLVNENGVVTVSFLPGKHQVLIEWHVNQPFGFFNHTPSIELDTQFSNLSQTIKVPRDRWLLWGGSAGVGPAFLYWGELLVFIILAFFLARIKHSPLKTGQWLALGCAFGTFSWPAFLVVASWLFFVGWKQQFNGYLSRAKSILLQWFSLLFTVLALGVFIGVVAYGLLSYPDMGVAGNMSSSTQLYWYLDSSYSALPEIILFSVPLWCYKLLILFWSIWVSFAVLDWLKQIFSSLNRENWWPKFNKKPITKPDEPA